MLSFRCLLLRLRAVQWLRSLNNFGKNGLDIQSLLPHTFYAHVELVPGELALLVGDRHEDIAEHQQISINLAIFGFCLSFFLLLHRHKKVPETRKRFILLADLFVKLFDFGFPVLFELLDVFLESYNAARKELFPFPDGLQLGDLMVDTGKIIFPICGA